MIKAKKIFSWFLLIYCNEKVNKNKNLRGSWKKYLVWRGVKLQIRSTKVIKKIVIY